MKKSKKHDEKMVDIFTGVILGGLVGLYFPLGAYQPILVILAVLLVGRVVLAIK